MEMTVMLVGNKCDIDSKREVTYEEGKSFAQANGLLFIEASAKNDTNVDEAFFDTARSINHKIEEGIFDMSNGEAFGIKTGGDVSVKAQPSARVETKTTTCC
eukprot:TRINITY_DN527_c0_g1_i2.p3 TRINITY_DN527_c0_g1~~TRINITY_DN527_c0_g1_i2.p3  ORF type:complete len:102 (-),score=22.82 TRINITY_DN527_c0_g1_i2:114-419(-)